MLKKVALYVALICTANTGLAQNIDDSIYTKYSSGQKFIEADNKQPDFYILQLADTTPQRIKNKLILSAGRKLSENIFIINKNVFKNLFIPTSFQKKLSAANNYWKFSPLCEQLYYSKNKNILYRFTIKVESMERFERSLYEIPDLKQQKTSVYHEHFIYLVANFKVVEKYFLNNNNVIAIDIITDKPREESGTPGFDLSANKINVVHSRYPLINGSGEHVSIKENYYDTTDIDIRGRYEYSPLASKIITNHANYMATIIAGAGNSVYYAKGVADAALISSSSFEPVLPDADTYYLQNNISVQNHSYGTSIDNNYGLNAEAFDKSANFNTGLLHVFSSGNSGTDTSKTGNYVGVAGYANITGNFKMAKNALVVGAVDSFGNVAPLSSKGPAYDGRILPDLVAFQMNGTSESAALVSGTSILLQQYFKIKNNSVLPSALVKAILINTADDVNNPGPDYATGFGNMNAMKAMECIDKNKILSGTVSQDFTKTFSLPVPENVSLLKITLTWNDTAASPFAPKALVNDLDLELALPSANAVWKPWVLSSYPNSDSLNNVAIRKRDSLNNIEQITLQNPLAGNYQINVKGFKVVTPVQDFYIAYSTDSLNDFSWQRLADVDFAEGETPTILRWQTTYTGTGIIEYKLTNSNSWNVISNADLSKKYFYWTVPDTVSQAMLRMKIGSEYFYSDTFLITTLLNPKAGFICGDSILIYWNKINGVNKYQLSRIGAKYMEPFLNVPDTFAIISRNNLSNNFIAVSPVILNNIVGQRSYAFDYTIQGAGCFINSFYTSADGNIATITLSLGTIYDVNSISFEKLAPDGYVTIYSTAVNGLEYTYNYLPLKTGITYFRAKIFLNSGKIIYSDVESVFYVAIGKYLLIPVPVKRNSDINIFTPVPDGEIITLFDVTGRTVFTKPIQFTHELITTSSLQAGQYFYRITKKGLRVSSGKLIVL